MTHPTERTTTRPSRLIALLVLTPLLLGGCKKKSTIGGQRSSAQNAAPAPQRQTQPVPLRPDELNLATGVQFPPERVPTDEGAARAVASLASALSSGDADALKSMLDRPDAAVLDRLVSSGGWDSGADAIKIVRVCTIEKDAGSVRVGLGVQDDHGAYLLGWSGAQERDGWKFSALPIESPPAAKASDLDDVAMTPLKIPQAGSAVAETAPSKAPVDTKKKHRGGGRRPLRTTIGPG